MNIRDLVAKDGTRFGDPVKNSKYVRTFCSGCQEPMRCREEDLLKPAKCEQCGPKEELVVDLRDLHNYPSDDFANNNTDNHFFVTERRVRRKF